MKIIPIFNYVFVGNAFCLCFNYEPFREFRYDGIVHAPAIKQTVSLHPQV
ncbi:MULTISPECIES: hypothetical protein [unclassified Mesorhizobium]|nr:MULTISPECIES: hypothetical protein [unclassified Mesorhizobium]